MLSLLDVFLSASTGSRGICGGISSVLRLSWLSRSVQVRDLPPITALSVLV